MIAIIRVNLRRAIGDRRLLVVATVLPLMIILITGLLEGSPKEPVGLVNPSHRLLQLVQRTDDMKVRIEHSRAALDDDILRGRIVAGLIELPSARDAIRADFIVESATTDAVQARIDVVSLLALIAAEGTSTHMTDTTLHRTHTEAPLSPFAYVAPANLVLFMGITVLVLSSGLVESRRIGVLRRMAASPVSKRSIVVAQMVSLLFTAIAQAIGLLFIGVVLFGVHWGNPGAVALILSFFAVSISAVSVIIGTWSRSQEQAIAVSVVIGIAAGMLGGCVYQLSTVSNTVRIVGHVVPQAWAMDAFLKLIYDTATFREVLPSIGALAAFAVVLSALAVSYCSRRMYRGA